MLRYTHGCQHSELYSAHVTIVWLDAEQHWERRAITDESGLRCIDASRAVVITDTEKGNAVKPLRSVRQAGRAAARGWSSWDEANQVRDVSHPQRAIEYTKHAVIKFARRRIYRRRAKWHDAQCDIAAGAQARGSHSLEEGLLEGAAGLHDALPRRGKVRWEMSGARRGGRDIQISWQVGR